MTAVVTGVGFDVDLRVTVVFLLVRLAAVPVSRLAQEILIVSASSALVVVVLVDGLHHRRMLQQVVVMVEAVQAVRQLIEVLRDVMMGGGRGGHQGRRRRRRMGPALVVVVGAQQRVVVVLVLAVLLRLRRLVRPSRRVENVADHETRSRSRHERHGRQHGRRVLVGHAQHFSRRSVLLLLLVIQAAGPAGRTGPRRSGRQCR